MGGFDFNVIERSIGYLFREGMTFTLTLTGLAALGGIIFGTLLAMMPAHNAVVSVQPRPMNSVVSHVWRPSADISKNIFQFQL